MQRSWFLLKFSLDTGRLCSAGSGCQPFPDFIAPIRPSDFLDLRRPKLWSSLAFGLTVCEHCS